MVKNIDHNLYYYLDSPNSKKKIKYLLCLKDEKSRSHISFESFILQKNEKRNIEKINGCND